LLGALRSFFLKAEESKMVSGESVSGATLSIEAPINANNTLLDSQNKFCCQDLLFFCGLVVINQ
jgi:hypothetical protein